MKESVRQRGQNNETRNQKRRKREKHREKGKRERELKHRRLALLSIIAYRQAQTGQSEEKENTSLEGLE